MAEIKTYIYQTSGNKKFVYRCPHCKVGIMQVKDYNDSTKETSLLLWNYSCPKCKEQIVSVDRINNSFKVVFPPMSPITDEEFAKIKKEVGEKGIYLFSEI